MKHHYLILSVLLSLMSGGSFGQVERVFKANDISESALVDALAPDKGVDNPATEKTRSIRVSPAGDVATLRPKRPSAPMLVTFETNSAELTPRTMQMLDTLSRALQSDKLAALKFSIEGHTDPRGGEEFNMDLSRRRAETVVRYLSANRQIDRNRLVAVGKGQSQLLNTANPIAPENRRVTVRTIVE